MTYCSIVPPYILQALSGSDDPHVADRARTSLRDAQELVRRRHMMTTTAPAPSSTSTREQDASSTPGPQRTIGDAKNEQTTPGTTVRTEGGEATGDPAADEAYDGLGDTWTMYWDVFSRNSVDGKGLPLVATVHYGRDYDNAFWDGSQMVFGDGDGTIFGRFTKSIDVIGHELTHGVTQYTAGLNYQGQSGALNESVSDVFGSLVKQHTLGQSADQADWLIGADLLLPSVHGRALRDMLHPGTAYDDPQLGKDPQPADMSGYVDTSDDNGGVHTNSGIPNRAFALAATQVGGNAWETVGPVWYAVLTGDGIRADCDFATFADLTVAAAEKLRGSSSAEATAVRQAWQTVGVLSGDGSGTDASPVGETQTPSGPAHGDVPAGDARILLRRTGGVAGIAKERHVRLADLPDDDTSAWQTLLSSPTLTELAADKAASTPTVPDSFCYSLECERPRLHLTLQEKAIPQHIQGLFERTLDA
ncbi:Metalloprotease [Nostocoides japonicum T1-X7]|uniref:Neutral metalloproteinase n=1 Tax=Nostocoides japonicum T1-X7 TaxID=1194083 RepID=A0A077LU65_9MICO|nr:protealysin inhibitor emfourin [Tetrasphaera japonica]CCH77273.1 Metalloprotease [Tetrasphaera japonica T1-X7]